MQPERPRNKQKTPTTVPRSSRACHRCCHSCPTANCRATTNALSESTCQSRRPVHLHSIPWHSTPNQQYHSIFIMHPSFIEQCRPPQSRHLAEANLGTGTDTDAAFHTPQTITQRDRTVNIKRAHFYLRDLSKVAQCVPSVRNAIRHYSLAGCLALSPLNTQQTLAYFSFPPHPSRPQTIANQAHMRATRQLKRQHVFHLTKVSA